MSNAADDFRFSSYFELGDQSSAEWFDPFLKLDTELYVDPFLIYGNERDEFVGAHDEIVGFFAYVFEQVALSGGVKTSAPYVRAINNLTFREFEEACLGLTAQGTAGAGSGIDIAKQIAAAIWLAIESGAENLRHFEEVQIFGYGIGPDRISDATLRMILHRFASYTERIAKDLGVPTQEFEYPRSRFDVSKRIWIAGKYELPVNPHNQKAIFLAPKRYLRPFPTINHEDFWRYCRENEGVALAEIFGSDIVGKMPKEEIVKLALSTPALRERYVINEERTGGQPYDFEADPRGFVKWFDSTREFIRNLDPKVGFRTEQEFANFVAELIRIFQLFVEDQGGWRLLWNDNETPKREDAAQRLFLGVVRQVCEMNNVDISREVNIGRGPVDFKVSSGASFRALIELKLVRNTKFWNGLRAQLPTYLKAEEISHGWFVPIAFVDKEIDRISTINDLTQEINEKTPFQLRSQVIDARRDPLSGSKLFDFGDR